MSYGKDKKSSTLFQCLSLLLICIHKHTTHTHTQAPPPSNLVIGVPKQHCKGYLNRTATQRQAKSQDSRTGTKRPNYMYVFSKKFFFLCFILFFAFNLCLVDMEQSGTQGDRVQKLQDPGKQLHCLCLPFVFFLSVFPLQLSCLEYIPPPLGCQNILAGLRWSGT